jgi:hypothetical protein
VPPGRSTAPADQAQRQPGGAVSEARCCPGGPPPQRTVRGGAPAFSFLWRWLVGSGDMESGLPAAGGAAQQRARGRPRTRPAAPPRLQDRDRHLLGLLAIARYLDADQLGRLCFPGRHPSRSGVRLWQLADESGGTEWAPFVRSITARFPDGSPRQAWTLTDVGYGVAAALLGVVKRPNKDPAPQYTAHALATSELLVQLLSAGLRVEPGVRGAQSRNLAPGQRVSDFARADDPRYRWIASDSAQRPWKQYDQGKGVWQARELRPDAILEVPAARVRYFIECEMGTQTVVPVTADAPGSTVNKFTRYASFLNDGAALDPLGVNRTFYQQSFADDYRPELLFLVQSAARETTVAAAMSQALESWRKENPGRPAPSVQVAQLEGAVRVVQAAERRAPVSLPVSAVESAVQVLPADVEHLLEFWKATHSAFKKLRADARAQGLPPPEYPERIDQAREVLERLRR